MDQRTAAIEVMQKLIEKGYEVYIVGGYVRDQLLGREGGDIDLATNASPLEVVQLFKRTVPTGLKHGTVTVLWKDYAFEVTTFRTEGTYQDHRRPDEVHYVKSFEEDVLRRDFTMNALGLSIDGKVVDHVGGIEDIKRRQIHTVGDPHARMEEDALRMLRAFRFVSTLDFSISDSLLQAIEDLGSLIGTISQERIIQEFEKMIDGQAFLKALSRMKSTGFTKYLNFYQGGLEKLLEHDYFVNTFEEFYAVCTLFSTTEDFNKLPLSNQIKKGVRRILELYHNHLPVTKKTVFEYGLDVMLTVDRLRHYLDGQPLHKEEINSLYQDLSIKNPLELAITGRDLIDWMGKPGGPWVGEKLHEICGLVIDEELENDSEKIRHYLLKKG